MENIHIQNRNCMCRIKEYTAHSMRYVSLENELLKVNILVDKGADITEFLYKPMDIDCMWHSFNPPQNPETFAPSKPDENGTFLRLYEGGWQELFPTYGGACDYRGATYGLHGEVAVVPWQYQIEKDEPEEISIVAWVRTPATPLLLERRMRLISGNPCLFIEERAVNESPVEIEFMWGHHPVLGYPFLSEECEICLPEGGQIQTLTGSGVLPSNSTSTWPMMKNKQGDMMNLSQIQPLGKKAYREYGVSNLDQGHCCVWNKSLKLGFALDWDIEQFPYLWIWEPNAGMNDYPWYGRNYALGVEPWSHLTSNFESLLDDGQAPLKLEPWQEMNVAFQASIVRKEGEIDETTRY